MKKPPPNIILMVFVLFVFLIVLARAGFGVENIVLSNSVDNQTSGSARSFFTPLDEGWFAPQTFGMQAFELSDPYINSTQTKKPLQQENDEDKDIQKELDLAKEKLESIQEDVDYIRTHGEESPYVGKVELLYGYTRTEDPDEEYVELRVYVDEGERISLSGWSLKSTVTNRSATLPKASLLPRPSGANTKYPVVVDKYDAVFIKTGRSPIGMSFLVNMCTGYFDQFKDFYPSLPYSCPDPELEIESTKYRGIFTDNECMDYVESISRCSIATDLPMLLSYECKSAVLEEINYNSCVDKHRKDPDFIGDRWYLYLKRSEYLWRDKRETIVLLDADKRVVDSISY